MKLNILRASTALLIAITATVGVQAPSNQSSSAQNDPPAPAVLAAQTNLAEPPEPTREATPSPELQIEAKAIQAPNPEALQTPIPEQVKISEELKQKEKQEKVLRLQKFLKSHNSPMTDNAQDFIEAAEQYNLDWKLVPSIAGVESTFGKFLIPNSYNAYGWGGGTIHFESWRDGIYTVSKGLSEKYAARGLITPYQIQPVYAPPSHTWGGKVTFFMAKIDSTTLEPEDK